MTNINLYNFDHVKVVDVVDVPEWVDQDITCYTIATIIDGGCDSGAYMPAVTYHQAADTMNVHGNSVLDYIQDTLGELPAVPDDTSWQKLAVHYLSCAVELWASSVEDELLGYCEELEQDEE